MSQPQRPYSPSLTHTVTRWLYTCLLLLVVPLVAVSQLVSRSFYVKATNRNRLERFGLVPTAPQPNGYLFHCVSVGEVVAASCVIKRLRQEQPDIPITVTTTTATGSARVTDLFANQVHHCYLPYDLPMCMAGLLSRIRPRKVLITEVELWPNLIHACWKRNIPAVVINARMTERSAGRYHKLSALFVPMLKKLSHVCAQGQRDYDGYLYLGLEKSKLTLTNNIKFDQAAGISVNGQATGFLNLSRGQRPVLIGGSTHDPEEAALLDAAAKLRVHYPNLLLVLVPRHPQRFDTVAGLLVNQAVVFVRTSEVDHIHEDCQVVLVDEMGKLNQVYSVANMAFVGGSLADRGGHNALEPAAQALPILMGPHTYNNPIICEYLQEQGALTLVNSSDDIARICLQWLAQPEEAKRAGVAGLSVLQNNSGAVEKTLDVIRAC
ncbi:3-deoxy-D-manno-octulosonic acid transferase [Alteromonas aestuariivivens]|uniref:3-deoxy-D-manno-octulosonic acid transferase n=1 Tax=Alteromonas aestuariivivens TaxID=1938339 RepID=A0A3D8M9T8_9ALTE|nr:lipid IV(A) 3-deoxy-D-manno-octulosonic acid transferase [Alteromonas aestuariivivens]RDV26746.1 3-deoxy-D-manno-octulosonic acid transferase [Alteromonas aestuariivivens]